MRERPQPKSLFERFTDGIALRKRLKDRYNSALLFLTLADRAVPDGWGLRIVPLDYAALVLRWRPRDVLAMMRLLERMGVLSCAEIIIAHHRNEDAVESFMALYPGSGGVEWYPCNPLRDLRAAGAAMRDRIIEDAREGASA